MKKYLYLLGAFSTALFSSCEKDFTCTCIETNSLSSDADTYTVTIKDAKKTHAKAACASTERESTTYTYVNGAFTQVPVTYTSTCELD
jgi:hypothetical protein